MLAGRLLLVVGGCLVGLLLAEGALRLVGYRLGTDSAFQADPYCGVRHVPNYRGWHTREGHVWIEINSRGCRDRERTLEKPADTFRIAVVGDSYSEAFQVELDDAFWSVLERKLAASWQRRGRRVEVLNFGVSGYGTAQELEMLRHYVWDYQPDMILLQFFAANDVRNNSRKLDGFSGRPYYTLDGDRLVLDDSFLQDPERIRFQTSRWIKFKDFCVQHSRVAALVYQLRNRKIEPAPTDGTEAGLAMQAFREPDSPEWRDAWAVTDRLVMEMASEARSHGAAFAVLMANCGLEVDPDDAVRQRLAERLGVDDLLYPERRLAALGAAHGFPVIRLAEDMCQYCGDHYVYAHGFANTQMGTGHWNETGHRLAGELAADQLLEEALAGERDDGRDGSDDALDTESQADSHSGDGATDNDFPPR
jgi:hypothetical protein